MTFLDDLSEARNTGAMPAVAAAVFSGDGVDEIGLVGVRRVDRSDLVARSDLFHLGSNTKAFTGLLAAIAVDRGVLRWDTSSAEVLGVGTVTLKELLTHRARLMPYTEDEDIDQVELTASDPAEQRREFARLVLSVPPMDRPLGTHLYSNAGYAVAAAMVETATGVPWEDAIADEVFEPLGLRGAVGWPATAAAAAPLGHRTVDGRELPHDPASDDYALPAFLGPAGDISMAIGDYATFLADQIAGVGGHGRLGPQSMYAALHTPDPPDEPDDDTGYALGWGVRHGGPGGPMSMHTGSAGTFYAVAVLEPSRNRGVAALCNSRTDAGVEAVHAFVLAQLRGAAPG